MPRFLTLFLATCLCVVAQGRGPRHAWAEETVTDKDDGREGGGAEGGTLILGLEGSPRAGDSRQVAEKDPERLKARGESLFGPRGRAQPWNTEEQVFRFTALASGSSVLKLRYARVWEKGKPPTMTHSITVHVH